MTKDPSRPNRARRHDGRYDIPQIATTPEMRGAVEALIRDTQAPRRSGTLLKAAWIETPIGPMLSIACEHALHILEFAERLALPTEIRRLCDRNASTITFGRTALTEQVEAELTSYFSSRHTGFAVRLALQGTPFERLVWDGLRQIPIGEQRTYAALAAEIGRPAAVRAVGRANGANPIAIIVPCHRLVGGDGALTGYGGGLWRKQWLLQHERRFTDS